MEVHYRFSERNHRWLGKCRFPWDIAFRAPALGPGADALDCCHDPLCLVRAEACSTSLPHLASGLVCICRGRHIGDLQAKRRHAMVLLPRVLRAGHFPRCLQGDAVLPQLAHRHDGVEKSHVVRFHRFGGGDYGLADGPEALQPAAHAARLRLLELSRLGLAFDGVLRPLQHLDRNLVPSTQGGSGEGCELVPVTSPSHRLRPAEARLS
mmetsp:Transcript_105690/g.252083  ORF Transcript_105690/g.252083 Transcript_105690/m.252083 type:complete len:209 (+) Transcript_105690:235-861(+)